MSRRIHITDEEARRIMHPTKEELHEEYLAIMEKAKSYEPNEEEIEKQDFIWNQLAAGVSAYDILRRLGHTDEELKIWKEIEKTL